MSKSRTQTIGLLIVGAIGLVALFIAGLWIFMTATTKPIHPDPNAVVSTAATSAPPAKWADAAARGREIARAALLEQNLPGLSVAVGVGGEIVWAEAFGWADVENRVGATPETAFRLGTASKMLTSTAVGVLVDEGLLKLDDEIQTYVREFPKKKWPVTLRQLMGHLAGVRRDAGDEEPMNVRCERPVDVLPRFAKSDLLFEPGTQFRYSNYGWTLLTAAIEAASRERYSRFLRARVFEPAGMTNTAADSGTEPIPSRTVDYFPRFAADPYYGTQGPESWDFSCFSGAAALYSTPSDMVRFVAALDRGALLKPATVAMLQTSQRVASGEATGYGLGWDLEAVDIGDTPTQVVGYDGNVRDGIVMSLIRLPDGMVVVVMSNIAFTDSPGIARKITEAFR